MILGLGSSCIARLQGRHLLMYDTQAQTHMSLCAHRRHIATYIRHALAGEVGRGSWAGVVFRDTQGQHTEMFISCLGIRTSELSVPAHCDDWGGVNTGTFITYRDPARSLQRISPKWIIVARKALIYVCAQCLVWLVLIWAKGPFRGFLKIQRSSWPAPPLPHNSSLPPDTKKSTKMRQIPT